MADASIEVPLPKEVEEMLQEICARRRLPLPDSTARRSLSMVGEVQAISVLQKIASVKTAIANLNRYIVAVVKNSACPEITSPGSPQKFVSNYDSPPISPCTPKTSSFKGSTLGNLSPQFISSSNASCFSSPSPRRYASSLVSSSSAESPRNVDSPPPNKYQFSQQELTLEAELEFRKLFLLRSYIKGRQLEDVLSEEDVVKIVKIKHKSMLEFESIIWKEFGSKYCQPSDRSMYLDWDSGKTHLYHCHVEANGKYYFKGPYLATTRTHLQRVIEDDNVLIVKFAADTNISIMTSAHRKILHLGIFVGLRRYRFLVFKDGGKEKKISTEAQKTPSTLWVGKCHFVRVGSLAPWDERDPYVLRQKTIQQARCLFMHVHTVPNISKYMARLSLILSQTIKLKVDLASVDIERIEDIPCRDENGHPTFDLDGQPLIHTDGTGFISEDIALLCPKDFQDAKCIKDAHLKFLDCGIHEEESLKLRGNGACLKEPPLLIQCRLFHEGLAVKGTLLVNKKLKHRTIQIRPSMIKVEKDPELSGTESFNSLEVVKISHKPKSASLSKYLIALLSVGGVPKEYFLGLVDSALEDSERLQTSIRAALKVARNHGDMDECSTSERMIMAGIPLNEPFLQNRLSQLANEERKGLGGGKLPITESFYLMGTADPTGVLNSNEVCIILDNGPISGKVLVYRNPGLHFGDIHVLNAVYVKDLEHIVGNAKYAIFFSTKGRRSVGNEIANGDFDGDLYWVSRNPELLHYFKASEPWVRISSTPNALNIRPTDFPDDRLEHELFRLLFATRKQSSVAGVAADTWLALMDRFLTLGDDDNAAEKHAIKNKMLQLIDLYYDALDAAKSGKKVEIPERLKVEKYPHYMERNQKYDSTSVLGLIYDRVQAFVTNPSPMKEIWKLPHFDVEVPDACLNLWKKRYNTYRYEMMDALRSNDEWKNGSTSSVIKKYKQMLYDAADLEESTRKIEDIYNEALAIYHVVYDYAISKGDVGKCLFVWRVAGSALCQFHIMKLEAERSERSIRCLPSILKELY